MCAHVIPIEKGSSIVGQHVLTQVNTQDNTYYIYLAEVGRMGCDVHVYRCALVSVCTHSVHSTFSK